MSEIEKVEKDVQEIKEIETKEDSITAPKKRGAKKGQLSEKTKEALAKGREKLSNRWQEDRKEKEELIEKYSIKKANKKLKEKLNIKKSLGVDEDDSEEEEPIKIIQPKKPKKKQTIILPDISDSEEEIVYKKEKKEKKISPPVCQTPKQNEGLKIVFY